MSIETVCETSLFANVLSVTIPALDQAIRRANISENIFVVLTMDSRLPAFSTKIGQDYYIGFDLKTAMYCLSLAGCVAHSSFYIDFLHQDRRPLFQEGCGPYYEKTWYEFLDTKGQSQKDIEEQVALMASAVWSIIAHEYCHISHGHLGVEPLVSNDPETIAMWRDPLTRRTLEFDADAGAALLTWVSWLGPVPKDLEKRTMDSIGTRLALLGNFVAAKVLEVYEINSPPNTGRTHPPAGVRSRRVVETAAEIAKKFFSHIPELERIRIICAPGRVVEEAYTLATGEPSLLVNALFQAKIGAPDELAKLLGRWARILPLLEKTKLGSFSLAPASMAPI